MGRDRNVPNRGDVQTFNGTEWAPSSMTAALFLAPSIRVVDASFAIMDDGDNTKLIAFQAGTQGSGFTTTIDVNVQTASRSIFLPIVTGNDTLAALGVAQSFTAAQTFTNNIAQTGTGTFSTGTGAVSLNGVTTVTNTTSASTSLLGALVVGNGTAATSVAIGGGKINAGGTLTAAGSCVLANATGVFGTVSIGDNNTGNSAVRMFGTSAQVGWQIGSNITVASALEITPATAAGGTTFTTPAIVVKSSGPVELGSINSLVLTKAAGTTLTVSSTNATAVSVVGGVLAGSVRLDSSATVTSLAGLGLSLGNVISASVSGIPESAISINNTAYVGFAGSIVYSARSDLASSKHYFETGGVLRVTIDSAGIAQTGTGTISSGTGLHTWNCVTEATAIGTAADVFAGGVSIAKTLISANGRGAGITSTVTAASTTTLTISSDEVQTWTGSTAGKVIQFPAANLMGAGVAVLYSINNQSSVTVTPTRAGSDTYQGGATTDPVLAGASQSYKSDGVSVWLKV